MVNHDVIRPFVEQILGEILDVPAGQSVEPDDDGNYGYRSGSVDVRISIEDLVELTIVRFSALLVEGVRRKHKVTKVLGEANSAQQPLRLTANDDGQVIASWAVPVECLNRQQFKLICEEFGGFAESLSHDLAEELGGKPPHKVEEEKGEGPVRA